MSLLILFLASLSSLLLPLVYMYLSAWISIGGYFRYSTVNTRNVWDYVFDISAAHPSFAVIKALRYEYDTLGEAAFVRLSQLRDEQRRSRTTAGKDVSGQGQQVHVALDLYHILQDNAHTDATLSKMWAAVNHVPSWVNFEQIARGQDCFHRYGVPLTIGLAFQSLLAGMGAARIVEVLSRTGGFQTNVARRRLLETTQFVLQCTESVDALKPEGKAFASCVRVRLLHAAVRKKLLALSQQNPSYYDVEALGIPINDLDSIATITSFSSTLIWIALPRQGYVT